MVRTVFLSVDSGLIKIKPLLYFFLMPPLRLGGKLILNMQKVSRQAAKKEHKET
jgi:hypothetical protein